MPHTIFIHFISLALKQALHQSQEHPKHLWQKWGGHVHPSPPRGDAPAARAKKTVMRSFAKLLWSLAFSSQRMYYARTCNALYQRSHFGYMTFQ